MLARAGVGVDSWKPQWKSADPAQPLSIPDLKAEAEECGSGLCGSGMEPALSGVERTRSGRVEDPPPHSVRVHLRKSPARKVQNARSRSALLRAGSRFRSRKVLE